MLRSVAATALLAGAGCLSTGGDDRPAYTDWVPADDDGFAFAYAEFDITAETEDDDIRLLPFLLPAPSDDGNERPVELPDGALGSREDPLLSFPVDTGGWVLAGAHFAFWGAGLRSLVERGQSETVEQLLAVGDVAVGTGEFDTDALDRRLRSDSGSEFGSAYERVEDTGAFRFYERTETEASLDNVDAVALGEDRVVIGPDRDAVERVLETTRGERSRAVDSSDAFDWLVETAGDGNSAVGWHGPLEIGSLFGETGGELARELFTTADDVLASVTLDPETGEVTVDVAVHSDSLPADRRDTLESTFGGDDRETSVSADGTFSVSGQFDEIPFQPLGSDWTDDLPSGDDLPTKITQAVPEGAVEIVESPNREDVYRVELGDVRADEVVARAIEADREATVDSPASTNWVTVDPDPDGDEIRVVVTVDDVSGVVATRTVP